MSDEPLAPVTTRPRLRTAYMLFGVIATAAATSAATHYALCDRDGAPACGNIGQLGRDAPPPPAPAPIPNTTITYNAPLLQITITQRLVAAPPQAEQPANVPVASPLADYIDDAAVGNVMTKGGRRH